MTLGIIPTPESLEAAITPRSKWLLLNMPSNPTGVVYSRAELRQLGEVLARHPQVMILSDEIYEQVLFDRTEFVSFGSACPELRQRTLLVNGVSKAYAMTGWRIGYGAGPSELIAGMTTVQSQSTTGACSIAQAAAAAALTGPQHEVERFREAFEQRRNLVVSGIGAIDGLELDPPSGAFYAFIDCTGFIGTKTPDGVLLADDTQFTEFLLNQAGVAAVPGSAYGLSPFFRLSTATSNRELSEAIRRIGTAVALLS